MSLTKTAKIGDKPFIVRELTLREIREMMDTVADNPVDALALLLTSSTTATAADLLEYAPSEIQPFVDAMLEVNNAFFVMAEAAGMEASANALRGLIRSIFLPSFATSSSAAMGLPPGTTDTASL